MVLAVSVIYGLCWMPNQFIYLFNYFIPSQNYGNVIYIVSIVFVSCNSTVNPFIYVFVNQKFRRKVKSLICCGTPCSNRVGVSMDSTTHTNQRTNTTNLPTLEEEICSGLTKQEPNSLSLVSVWLLGKVSVFPKYSLLAITSQLFIYTYLDRQNEKLELLHSVHKTS